MGEWDNIYDSCDVENIAFYEDKQNIFNLAMNTMKEMEKNRRLLKADKPKPKSFKDKENDALVKHLVAM